MVKLFAITWCMSLVPLFLCEKAEDSLILAHVLARHGNRTVEVDFVFPTYPMPSSFYPYGAGEITLAGKKLMVRAGKGLRRRYRDFLGDCYSNNLIEAISSDYKRTMMSLQCILAGLFVPSNLCTLKGDLNWQPVPFSYLPSKNDKLLAMQQPCPSVLAVETEIIGEELELYKYISKHAGTNITNSFGMFAIFWNIENLLELGYDAPEWVIPVWPQLLKKQSRQLFQEMIEQKLKILTGSLMFKIHEDSQNKINGSFEPKMVIYSGHDVNMAGLMGACGMYNGGFISYGSYMMIELHKIQEEYYVKILIENYNFNEPEVMKLPGCSEFCEFSKFVEMTNKIYPNEDWCS